MKHLFLPFTLLIVLAGCKKDEELVDDLPTEQPPIDICETGLYCFESNGNPTVDYSEQLVLLNQLEEITSYMKTANTPGTAITATQLSEMLSNNEGAGSSYFSSDANTPGLQLRSLAYAPLWAEYETYLTGIQAASESMVPGSNGQAGVVVSTTDPSKQYLFNAEGIEYTQLIEKGLMGDIFYYQSMMLLEAIENEQLDNTVPMDETNGLYYTEMEHAFDAIFGYFGIPNDFPLSTNGVRFHGKYCNGRNSALGTNSIATDFFSARTFISTDNDPTQAIANLRMNYHLVIAGTAVHYLISGKNNYDDLSIRCHALSEAIAFIRNLRHGQPAFALTDAEIDQALGYIGENLYEITIEDIHDCIQFMVDHTAIELTDLPNL